MTTALYIHRLARLTIAAVTVAFAATTAVSAQQDATYEVVSSFGLTFRGGRAPSSLRQDSDGTFFGTTSGGGLFDDGILFRMDVTGVVTPLHSFSDAEGSQPFGLARASNGRFYGFTRQGGEFELGTVFSFTPGSAPTTVHAFSQADNTPVDLYAATDGNVYGLTAGGGDFENGTIFAIDSSGTFRTILSIPLSAGRSMTSLVRASDGRFYVTAGLGGVGFGSGAGTVFTIDDAGTVTVLHSFVSGGGDDGFAPVGLMQRSDGRVFGTTGSGGEFLGGTVYSIDSTGNYQVLHSFDPTTEGRALGLDLVEASDGNLYGVTSTRISTDPGFTRSFRIDSSGTLTILQDVSGPSPADLTLGSDQRLYGPTAVGGLDGGGTIITIDLAGTRTTVYEFSMGEGPGRPNGVIQGSDGGFYGITSLPSATPFQVTPIGTVFAMDAAGVRTTLHTFFMQVAVRLFDGFPIANLFEGSDGNLYGTAFNVADGFTPPGPIFRISPQGLFTPLAFSSGLRAGVIQARDERLYGTSEGAVIDPSLQTFGTVFRIETSGSLTVLHRFDGTDTANPVAELVEIDDGSLYGTTVGGSRIVPPPAQQLPGTIFRIDPATGSFAIRHRFTDGSRPTGRLIQGTDGLIYGTTVNGGDFGLGTVFSFDASGTLTTLHHFSGADGANPNAGVIQGLDGRLYGTTTNGGTRGYGTMFVMSLTGGLTTLHHFALSDGANPVNELIQANDGALYGAAPNGGPKEGGVIFRVRLTTSAPDQFVEIVSRNSGKCLDVYGASTDAAAPAIQWTCHGGLNQQWRLEPAGGGGFRIIARHSGQALDVFGALLDDVTPIIQYPVHGGDNQVWTLEPAPDGHVRIVARHSGKAMDVEFASADDGARAIQYTPHGGANQQWLLRPVGSTEP